MTNPERCDRCMARMQGAEAEMAVTARRPDGVATRRRVAWGIGLAVAVLLVGACNELLPIDQGLTYACATNDDCGFSGYQCVLSAALDRKVCRPSGFVEDDVTADAVAEVDTTGGDDGGAELDLGAELDVGPEIVLGAPCGDFGLVCPVGASCDVDTGYCTHTDGMMHIAGGTFFLGCDPALDVECSPVEAPVTQVSVAPFKMDRQETTAGEYGACVSAGGCSAPQLPPGGSGGICTYGVAGRESHPMNCLIQSQAAGYCAWRNARLCSETQWELAARGSCDTVPGDCQTNMRKYPWGSEAPTCNLANSDACAGDLLPVGQRPLGASIYGVEDLSGNVREWVADGWTATHEGVPTDGSAAPAQTYYVKRGGAYLDPPADMRASTRAHDAFNQPVVGGIRCCSDFVPAD